MKSFEDNRVLRQPLTPALLSTVRVIGEYGESRSCGRSGSPKCSTASRNWRSSSPPSRRTGWSRLRRPGSAPRTDAPENHPANRPEEEIAGYRDVLATIHTSHPYVPVRPNIIAQLHRDLLKFSAGAGGKWKQVENEIADFRSDGSHTTRFKCVSVALTPEWMERLCDGFNRLRDQEAAEALLLIPAFVLDFLCIHPFLDGNGRMARLLTLLLLYQAGYEVGRYISLERIIEESKESYYESLEGIQPALARGAARPVAVARLFPGHDRRRLPGAGTPDGTGTTATPGAKRNMIREAVDHFVAEFTSKELELACPIVSREMIRVVLRELQARERSR